jgi:hypothetical protein
MTMNRKLRELKGNRREFLRNLAAAGGVAAVAGATGHAATRSTPELEPETHEPEGYRVTDHVAKYYQKARI